MRLILSGSEDTIIGKNSSSRDLGKIWKDEEMDYHIKKIVYRYLFIFYED